MPRQVQHFFDAVPPVLRVIYSMYRRLHVSLERKIKKDRGRAVGSVVIL